MRGVTEGVRGEEPQKVSESGNWICHTPSPGLSPHGRAPAGVPRPGPRAGKHVCACRAVLGFRRPRGIWNQPPRAEGRLHLPLCITCKRKETWGATAPASTQCPGSPGHLGGPGSPRFPPAPWGCGPCNEGTVSGGAEQPRLPQPALEGSLVHGAASADPEGGQSYSLVSWLVTRAPGGVWV